MNAAEQLVEAYFQYVGGCFTRNDIKVLGGMGRQFDLVALKPVTGQIFHIEVDVTHELGWCRPPQRRATYFEKKFFGVPPERNGSTGGGTDFERGKNYFSAINEQYRQLGFKPSAVTRVWVSWVLHEDRNARHQKLSHNSIGANRKFNIHFLSFRNLVLPALLQQVGKSNYENEMLRVLSLTKQRAKQIGVSEPELS